ncbi:MAG: MFS transporter [Gemmatimonadota bacterium]|jgi:DHA1 family tetracycline resistance protein-like MFS transporter
MEGSAKSDRTAVSRVTAAGAAPIMPILAINFVATLGFSIVLPFLVYVVTRYGGNAFVYGVMGATYSFFQLIGAPVLGRWSDRIGRKRVLLLSQLGTAASWGLFLIALALPATPLLHARSGMLGAFTLTVPLVALFTARALDGITGGNASVANAYLADITPDQDRTANFGRLAVSANLGFIVGPALAGLLGATRWREAAPVAAAFVISAVACLMIVVGLRESTPCSRTSIPERRAAPRAMGQESRDCFEGTDRDRMSLARAARIPHVPRLLLLDFLVFLAFNIFYVVFPIYVVQDLHWPLATTGIFFGVLSLLMVLVQGPVLTWAGRRWSQRTLVLAGSAILAVSFPFFGASRTATLYVGATLLALGNGLMWPSLLALLSGAAGAEAQGAVQGLAGSASAMASILGLLIGGLLFELLGANAFLLSAVITAVVCLSAFGIQRAAAPSHASA